MSNTPFQRLLDKVEWKACEVCPDDGSGLLRATHEGILQIGESRLRVYQLEDVSRIINADDIAEFFGAVEGNL